jgi:hypothetical protein
MRGNLVQVLLFSFGDGTAGTKIKGVLGLETIFLCGSREDLRVGMAKHIVNSIDVNCMSCNRNMIGIGMNINAQKLTRTMLKHFVKTDFMWTIDYGDELSLTGKFNSLSFLSFREGK